MGGRHRPGTRRSQTGGWPASTTDSFRNPSFHELKSIAQAEVGADRRIHGAAIVKASFIREAKLEVRAKEPPPHHADIIGWPWSKDEPDFGKAEQKGLAALIAQKAGSPLRFSV